MDYNNVSDLAFSPDGDFELKDGDFALASEEDCMIDDIDMVVKTQKGDSVAYPRLGANLEELVGKRNVADVASEGAARIAGEIIANGIANAGEVDVIPIPVGQTILYYVFINGSEQKIEYVLDLTSGGIS